MTRQQEQEFIQYWEENRDRQGKWTFQLLKGLPVGMGFAIPVVIILITSRFWYKRADMAANAELNPFVLGICVLAIVTFVAIFYKRYQWDRKEQQYLEFKARAGENTNIAPDKI